MLCQWRLESRMFSIVCTAVKVTCAVIFNQGLFQVTSLLVSAYASTDKLKILNYSQEIFSKYLPPFLPNTGVEHHWQFDHKYRPGQPKIDTADTKNRQAAFTSCHMLRFLTFFNATLLYIPLCLSSSVPASAK